MRENVQARRKIAAVSLLVAGYFMPLLIGEGSQVHCTLASGESSLLGYRTPAPYGWTVWSIDSDMVGYTFDPLAMLAWM